MAVYEKKDGTTYRIVHTQDVKHFSASPWEMIHEMLQIEKKLMNI